MLQGWTPVHLSRNNRERNRTLMHLWTYSGEPYWITQQWVLFHTVKLSLAVVKQRSMVKGTMGDRKASPPLLKNTFLSCDGSSPYLKVIKLITHGFSIDWCPKISQSWDRDGSSAITTASSNIWSTPKGSSRSRSLMTVDQALSRP